MVSHSRKPVDYRPVLYKFLREFQQHNAITLEGIMFMANNFDRLTAAVALIGTAVVDVAAAIRNPATNLSDQPTIDALASQLETAAAALAVATADENAEDGTVTTPVA